MNLHQFRYVQEAVRRGLNLTEAAKALHTSQPGVSKAILDLEQELGIDIFVRHGKRLRGITEPGQHVVRAIDNILLEVGNLKRIGEHYTQQQSGRLSIATTHTQARYFLPGPVAELRRRYPQVRVELHQGTPDQVARMLLTDQALIGLATESLQHHEGLVTLPCYDWQHLVVVPRGHPLAQATRVTLEQLAAHPLVTYHPTVTGRSRLDQAFERARLKPEIALEALDSDVIKTYVRLGLGVGILAEMAMREEPADADLVALPAGHLFGTNVSRVAFRRGAWLREFELGFAELLSPRLSRSLIQRAMLGGEDDYEL
ncbi:MAG: CysB family HTH-type transcriptional regulator [Rubrivivax sp.]|nr:CysB family HTH-type transcriptional regulator [Rubrivivax sp.]